MPRLSYHRQSSTWELGFYLSILGLFLVSLAAWATHIIWIVRVLASDKGATFGQCALGAIGAFMPPVGVLHGILIWLGLA